jgi:hypothetical protein
MVPLLLSSKTIHGGEYMKSFFKIGLLMASPPLSGRAFAAPGCSAISVNTTGDFFQMM